MNAEQALGATLLATTAITAICSTRVYHGLRPDGTAVPCVNFYRVSSTRKYGFERASFTVNCRATTAQTALQVARLVEDLFAGSSGNGTYGYQTSFEISRATVARTQGLIPETADKLYNAPVEITMVYPTSSVS